MIRSAARGGLKTALEAMRFYADDEVIAAFLHKYDSIPQEDRFILPWEAIALSANINTNHLLGSTVVALANYCANKTRLIAVTAHPAITKARVKYALLPSGEKDRNAIDTSVGWLPKAGGPTFIGKAVFGPSGGSSTEKETEVPATTFEADDELDQIFPPSSTMQEKLVPIRQKLLKD